MSHVAGMADSVSRNVRSKIMASVATRDTKPEMALRKVLHTAGFRYRVHYRSLLGKPDIAFPARRKVIFVHGCFWHGHACRWGRLPKTRLEYWKPKIAANQARDLRSLRAIRRMGWKVMIVWQCEIRDFDRLWPRILKFLARCD